MPAPALRIEGLTRRFGERDAISDVSLTLAHGSTLAVLGRNGAGKSTLLRILASLLRPHSGAVEGVRRGVAQARAFAVRGAGSGCWRTSRCCTAS